MDPYQFTLSFKIVGSTDDPPPEIVLPSNVTPLLPPIGSVLNIPSGIGAGLIQGTVQSFAFSINPEETVVIISIVPIVGAAQK